MILINGENIEHIPVNDRGFQYGDGLFETIEVINSRPVFLNQHLTRLSLGCARLKLPQPDVNLLTSEIKQICESAKLGVLKIIITRGTGGRGYKAPENIMPTRVLSLHPFPDFPEWYAETGVNARFCESSLGLNPTLAGIKHLNRLEQILARTEWDDILIQEGIMLDTNGHVVEGTMSNLFYSKDGVIYTSPIEMAGVAGIIRAIIMQICQDQGWAIIEHNYDKRVLLEADEIFISNSIIGIWPIKELSGVQFSVGGLTLKLQRWLTEYKARDVADVS